VKQLAQIVEAKIAAQVPGLAVLLPGGKRIGAIGYFVAPTVFTGVEHDMRISQEEIFGPVASVIKFETDEDAIRLANGTSYSLAAGVWTADMSRVHRFAKRLKAGTVWANTYGPTDVRLPWGGARDSGFGREHGEAAILVGLVELLQPLVLGREAALAGGVDDQQHLALVVRELA